MAEVSLTIDGVCVSVPEGTLLIEAARNAGIDIPHYCYHPALGNPGVCRLCMVEVEGAPKLQVACRLPAKAGMVVKTRSAAAKRAQSSALEFHLVNHPLDCPVCDQAGECLLQDYYQRHGLYPSSVREDKLHKPKRVELGPGVMLDAERCVLCTRCVRFLDEVTGTRELGVFSRGEQEEIALTPGKRLDNPYSGNVVDLCPVGALTERDFRFQVRVWYLESTSSVCTACARGCSIALQTNPGRRWHAGGRRAVRIKPRVNASVNGYWICDEGRASCRSVDARTRLSAPSMLRDGKAGAVAWDDAEKLVAAELSELCRTRGPKGLAVVLSGTLSNEDLYAAKQLFVERLGAGRILVKPGPDGLGEGDGLLRRTEKVPNLRGAEALGFGKTVQESSWDSILEGILSGEIWGLWAVDRDPLAVWGAKGQVALSKLSFTLHQAVHANVFTGAARWALPSVSHAEEDATFTNFQGRVQRARQALRPLGSARPDWKIFGGVLRALGAQFPHEDAASVFTDMALKEPAFKGLAFDLPPDGAPLR
jgi:NADH-quinone oxidoreductase subunit G